MKPRAGDRLATRAALYVTLALMLTASACGSRSTASPSNLPPNLTDKGGTQITAFDGTSGWSVTGGWLTADPGSRRAGAGAGASALRLTTVLPSGRAVAEKAISQDMSGGGLLRFWVFFPPDWDTTINSVNVRFSPGTDFAGSLSYYLSDLTGMHEGWNLMSVPKSDFVSTGGASWSNPMVRLRVELVADAGKIAQASFADLRCGVTARPAVVISFDDGDASVYSTAYPIMSAHGLQGTAYVVSSLVGTPGKMTLAQLQELYAGGWDIGNHTSTHADLSTLDLAAAERELSDCASFLTLRGMPRAARDVAYPDGNYNQTVLQAMAATGMLTGRTVSYRPEALPMDEPYLISASGANATQSTVAQIESSIDRAVRDGATIHLFFHALAPKADSYRQSTANFTAICDYIDKLRLPTLTISQWYALGRD